MKPKKRYEIVIFALFSIFLTGYFLYRSDIIVFNALVFNAIPAILLLLSGLAFEYQMLKRLFYQPPELHDGVIYTYGKFRRFVAPAEIVFILPIIDKVQPPISRHHHQVITRLSNVISHDGYPFDLTVVTTHSLNFSTLLRKANRDTIIESLKRLPTEWETLVRDQVKIFAENKISQSQAKDIKELTWRKNFETDLLAFLFRGLSSYGVQFDISYKAQVMNLVYFKSKQEAENEKEVNAIRAKSNKEILESIANLLMNDPNRGHQLLEACIAVNIVKGQNSNSVTDSALEGIKNKMNVPNVVW